MIPELEQIKALLRDQWDPIGLFPGWPGLDEYDSYAMVIYTMLKGGDTVSQIAEYLTRSASETMGVETIPEREAAVAHAAAEIVIG